MHVGILTSELTHVHGWGRYSLNLLQALHTRGVKLTVVTSHGSATAFDFPVIPVLPATQRAQRASLLRQMAAFPQVNAALKSCDVIHTIIEPFAPLGAAVKGSRPLVITGHGTYVQLPAMRGPFVNALYRNAFRRAWSIVCNSSYTEERLRAVMPEDRSRIVLLGVHAQGNNAVPFEKCGPVVLFVAAVKPRKGALPLVRAMHRVVQQIPDARCVMVGSVDASPEYVGEIRAEIERLQLHHVVSLVGHVADKAILERWYRTADMFVLPSMNAGWQFEGFGLVHLEAGLSGLPVIGTRECGARDAIDEGRTGLLVSQNSIGEELPDAIVTLLRDPELRQRMGAAGQAKALSQTWDTVAQAMIALYEESLHAHTHLK